MMNYDRNGNVTITVELTAEDWLVRVKSLINIVKSADHNFVTRDEIYYTLSMVEDMLPNENQAATFLKSSAPLN